MVQYGQWLLWDPCLYVKTSVRNVAARMGLSRAQSDRALFCHAKNNGMEHNRAVLFAKGIYKQHAIQQAAKLWVDTMEIWKSGFPYYLQKTTYV